MYSTLFVVIISILNIISFWHTLTNVCKTHKIEVPHRLKTACEGLWNAIIYNNFIYLTISVFDLPSLSIT